MKIIRSIRFYNLMRWDANDVSNHSLNRIHSYNKNDNAIVLPTYIIIEGYANFCEHFIPISFNNNDNTGYFIEEYFRKYYGKEKRKSGVYNATQQLLKLLYPIHEKKKATHTFGKTCLFIYELSLLTRLHPALLFSDNLPDITELFVPLRFARLMSFFYENEVVLEDFGGNKTDIGIMNEICDVLGWPSYFNTMHKLWSFVERYRGDDRDPYFYDLGDILFEYKIWGGSKFKCNPVEYWKEIPVYCYNEGSNSMSYDENLYCSGFYDKDIVLHYFDTFLKNVCATEFIKKDFTFKNTKAYLQKFFEWGEIRGQKDKFLEDSNLKFIFSLNSNK